MGENVYQEISIYLIQTHVVKRKTCGFLHKEHYGRSNIKNLKLEEAWRLVWLKNTSWRWDWKSSSELHTKWDLLYRFYFFNYILLIMLLLLSQFFPLCPPPLSTPYLQAIPHHCSCPCVMCIGSLATPFPVLYYTSTWLFCNYLFVLLSPLTSSPIPHYLLPTSQPLKYFLYPWFCLCSSSLLSLFFRFNCW